MSRYGVSPNMLVVPPQLLLYLSLAPEAKLTYKASTRLPFSLLVFSHSFF